MPYFTVFEAFQDQIGPSHTFTNKKGRGTPLQTKKGQATTFQNKLRSEGDKGIGWNFKKGVQRELLKSKESQESELLAGAPASLSDGGSSKTVSNLPLFTGLKPAIFNL